MLAQDSDGPPRPEGVHPPVFSALRQSRVVSSTSEEEEALTEKFLKINCKYITDGKVRSSIEESPSHVHVWVYLFKTTLYSPGHVTDKNMPLHESIDDWQQKKPNPKPAQVCKSQSLASDFLKNKYFIIRTVRRVFEYSGNQR